MADTNPADTREVLNDLYEELYEKYGRRFEPEHKGEFLAIARDGRTYLGTHLDKVAHDASGALGRGVFLYKIGDKAVGNMR